MTSDQADESAGGEGSGDRTVSVLGTEIVLEEAFVAFPWRAGMARAPGAFLAVFVLTAAVAAIGGFGSGSLQRRFALLGIVVFNAHNIPATTGVVPQILVPIAEPIVGIPGVGQLLRGLFTFGTGHTTPISHVGGILGGQVAEIGHLDLIARQSETDVPVVIYYLLAPVALVGAGYEFADSYWAETTTESFAEVARFGLAIAAGYLVVLLVGSVLFTAVLVSGLSGEVTILPDRYLLVVYGFAYPTIFATLGAWLVYRDRT
ncbi:hypothetical protein [Halosimplex pelagicum]|uniref:DUF7978 domain-containing protein n=1 Tax=Halosimplex pelagicum TaxID=869886 RepID=A0A7D5P484_9EURY|nr:hypothetical protein [Halosimplex pelagicum]QLH80337.1 hypothetical protein HZS54_01260 [Halosimplex pelagicum]